MKNKKWTAINLIWILALCVPFTAAYAADGKELFVKFTCFTCHGREGKGMFREETNASYRFTSRRLKKAQAAGVPGSITTKLKKAKKRKFKKEDEIKKALVEILGTSDARRYQELILNNVGKIKWKKGDRVLGFEEYPKLAGNKRIYLYMQMKDILEGRRVNSNTEAMRGILPFLRSNKFTDNDLKSIAKYLSEVR